MAVLDHNAEGIRVLSATDTTLEIMEIESVLLHGTAAGTFAFKLGNASFSIANTANALSVQIVVNRRVVGATLTSGPTGATMYVLMKKGV